MSLARGLKRFLASSASFTVSFLYSALSFEMGRGYAEYLPASFGPDPDHESDKSDKSDK